MQPCDRERFFKMMAVFSENYNRPISEGSLEMYFGILSEWSIEAVEGAGRDIMRNVRFFPQPADFAQRLETDAALSADEKALMAWSELMRVRNMGDQYASVEFADPAIAHALTSLCGGWLRLFDIPYEELKFCKKDFMALYKIHTRRNAPKIRLAGLLEQDGAAFETIRIGMAGTANRAKKLLDEMGEK